MVDHVIVQTVFVPQISGSIDCFYLLDENKWVINEEQATQFTKKGAQKLLELLGIDSDNIINFTVRPKQKLKELIYPHLPSLILVLLN